MDQVGYSTPALFNGQQGDDPETISLTLEDLRGSYWSESIAKNNLGQAVDLAYAHPPFPGIVQPRGAGLPFSSAYTDLEQSRGASLLLSPLNYADFSNRVLPPSASLPLSPAYTALEQSPSASLPLSPLSYADFSDHVLPPSAGLPLSLAYTALEQSPGASLPLSSLNHVDLACIGYRTYATELSLPQPQSNYDDIFPDDFPNYAFN
jgi:hypothetical protein